MDETEAGPGFAAIQVSRIVDLPGGFAELVALSLEEDFRALVRMDVEWRSGRNRFDAAGEAMFEARAGVQLAGICGLNRDPYTTMPGCGRVRHLYVDPVFRRRGIGRALVTRVLAAGPPAFVRVRLRTDRAEADAFYRTLGFCVVDGTPDVTHEILVG